MTEQRTEGLIKPSKQVYKQINKGQTNALVDPSSQNNSEE